MATTNFSDGLLTQVYDENLVDHEPDIGIGWVIDGATTPIWKTAGDRLYCNRNGAGDPELTVAKAIASGYPVDQTVACEIKFDTSYAATLCGIMLRYVDINNYLMLEHHPYETLNLRLVEKVAGVETMLAAVTQAMSTATWLPFAATAVGSAVTCAFNNTNVPGLAATTTVLAAGKAALGQVQISASDISYRNFIQTSLDVGGGGGGGLSAAAIAAYRRNQLLLV